MDNIHKILEELYEIDPSLRAQEKELQAIAQILIASKPQVVMSEAFKKSLHEKIIEKIAQKQSGGNWLFQVLKIISTLMAWALATYAAFQFVILPNITPSVSNISSEKLSDSSSSYIQTGGVWDTSKNEKILGTQKWAQTDEILSVQQKTGSSIDAPVNSDIQTTEPRKVSEKPTSAWVVAGKKNIPISDSSSIASDMSSEKAPQIDRQASNTLENMLLVDGVSSGNGDTLVWPTPHTTPSMPWAPWNTMKIAWTSMMRTSPTPASFVVYHYVYSGSFIPNYPKEIEIPIHVQNDADHTDDTETPKKYKTIQNIYDILKYLNRENEASLTDVNIKKIDIEVESPEVIYIKKHTLEWMEISIPAIRFVVLKKPQDYSGKESITIPLVREFWEE